MAHGSSSFSSPQNRLRGGEYIGQADDLRQSLDERLGSSQGLSRVSFARDFKVYSTEAPETAGEQVGCFTFTRLSLGNALTLPLSTLSINILRG